MDFTELLDCLSKECGMDRLEPDDSHMVHLGAGDSPLTIVGDPETRTVMLLSELGELPELGCEAFYKQALKANWLFQGGGGAALAINPETDILSLNRALPMDALDGAGFIEAVRSFLEFLCRWRELLLDWSESQEGDEAQEDDDVLELAEVPEDDEADENAATDETAALVSDDPLSLLRNGQMIRV